MRADLYFKKKKSADGELSSNISLKPLHAREKPPLMLDALSIIQVKVKYVMKISNTTYKHNMLTWHPVESYIQRCWTVQVALLDSSMEICLAHVPSDTP